MKKRLLKYTVLFFVVAVGSSNVGFSNALFSDREVIAGNEISTGCWAAPTVPEHVYPPDETVAGTGSVWLGDPYMDWTGSETTCPLNDVVMQYQYQSYHDEGMTSLAYSSGLLSSSMIPAPGTPDGTYYWRVRAYDGHTYSAWSGTWLLTVDRSIVPVAAGDVVINEVMWMGSNAVSTADEWIELKNRTGDAIDLAGWTIDGAGSGSSAITITSGVVPAGGYFLIGNYASSSSAISDVLTIDLATTGVSLDNGGEVLTLRNSTNSVVDATPTGAWEKSNNNIDPVGQRNSMERNDVPGTGTSWDDWHPCIDAGCNDTTFWDVEGNDYGTPGATNLSENDPSSGTEEEDEGGGEEQGEGDGNENDDEGGTSGDGGGEGDGDGKENDDESDTGGADEGDTGDEESNGSEDDVSDTDGEGDESGEEGDGDEGEGDGGTEGDDGTGTGAEGEGEESDGGGEEQGETDGGTDE